MADFKTELLNILGEIKGSGSFVSAGAKPFIFPGLAIHGVEEIGFPINAAQAKEIIKVAHKAPFGKGSETVLDATVRSAWEVDAGEISFGNPGWAKFIEGITEQIKPALGIEGQPVTANLYKLLVYETGDFFVAHKDSEKEKGMFGTLIVALPSKHTGGELAVRFDGREEVVDFSGPAGEYKIPFAAFYADCEHEIKPITSGYRVCLVYNLVQNKSSEKIEINPFSGYAKRLAGVLKASEEDAGFPKIVLLGHQYTPANFTMASLKLNDRPKAEALIQAARLAGFYVKLGLVTSYQTGELVAGPQKNPRKSDKRRYYDDYYDDEDLEENGIMGEVYDEDINVEHWMEDGIPPLRNIKFEEDDLISAIALNEGEPVEKQAEGYTGNAGMEMQYWYHYGAVFLWPEKYHYNMLASLEPANKLEWLSYYNKQGNNPGTKGAVLAKQLAELCMQADGWRKPDFSPLVESLVNINEPGYITGVAAPFLTNQLRHISIEGWLTLFEAYPYNCFENIFATAALQGDAKVTAHILTVIASLPANTTSEYTAFIQRQLAQLPAWLTCIRLCEKGAQATAKDILRNVLAFGKSRAGDGAWQKNITAAFTKELNRDYVNDVLMATITEVGEKTPIANQIIAVCKEDLQRRVSNKPQPPADWSRPVPETAFYKSIWNILRDFLQSPTTQVFNYTKVQSERTAMEYAISQVTIDLTMETIKKGSPHTLRLTKTQDAYQRELKKWKTDEGLLKKAEEW